MQQQVVRVISGVDQLAASAGLPPRPPAERLGGPFERKDVGGASRVNLAQLALSNHLASRRDRWQEKLVVGTHQGHAGRSHSPGHSVRLVQGEA